MLARHSVREVAMNLPRRRLNSLTWAPAWHQGRCNTAKDSYLLCSKTRASAFLGSERHRLRPALRDGGQRSHHPTTQAMSGNFRLPERGVECPQCSHHAGFVVGVDAAPERGPIGSVAAPQLIDHITLSSWVVGAFSETQGVLGWVAMAVFHGPERSAS